MNRPLDGVRVLDFSRFVAGPHCGRMLADFGADVVKVEPPAGDETRRWGVHHHGIGPFFAQQNCGKRSISIDLKAPEAAELCLELAGVADVLLENFRPGVMQRLGLSYAEVAARNPRLVYGTITGYGPNPERETRRALANVIHAEAGILERQGRWDGMDPLPLHFSAADTYSALQLLAGVLAALMHRERTGAGQHVEVAMADAMLSADDFAAFDLWGPTPPGRHPDPVLLRCEDGHVMVSSNPATLAEAFCSAIGAEDLLEDPRFATQQLRLENRKALVAALEERTSLIPIEAAELAFEDAGLPVARMYSTMEAVERAQTLRPGSIAHIDDRGGGRRPLISSPQRFSRAESGIRGVVPYRGEHNADVLKDWIGAQAERIAKLESSGVVVAPDGP